MYINKYIIMITMCPASYHHNGFVVPPALGDMMFNCTIPHINSETISMLFASI